MASRFTIVGLGATATHVGIVWALVTARALPPLPANLVAFLCAFAVSFTGQHFWTFRASRNHYSALRRFFVVSASAFLLNNVVLVGLLDAGVVPERWAAALAVLVIPPITYVLSRTWALR